MDPQRRDALLPFFATECAVVVRSRPTLTRMKSLAYWIAGLAVALPHVARGADFYVEDKTLQPLPAVVEETFRRVETDSDMKQCRLLGKSVELGKNGGQPGFVITTADACGWGASSGPIWVMRAGSPPTIVLSYGGYDVTLGTGAQNGLRHIAIGHATAGSFSESLWKFDGARYVKVKEKAGVTAR